MMIDTVKSSLKEAMIAKDSNKVTVLRGLMSGFTNELVATGKMPQDPVGDELALSVLKRQIKQRKDAIDQYIGGGREDLADSEKGELAVLETFMPTMASDEEIKAVAERKLAEMGNDPTKKGQLIGAIMKEMGALVDGSAVKRIVEGLLN